MTAAITLLLGAGLAAGFLPGVGTAAATFADQHGYVTQALSAVGQGPLAAVPDTGWTTSAVLTGLLGAALAVVVAAIGVRLPQSPAWIRPVPAGLHRLHSGHLGDYAAWLVFGAAAFTGLLVLR